jgi:ADP-ribose pyrophosphatase
VAEALEDAARRELIEETGYRVGSLQLLTSFHSSKSVMDETCTVYLGTDLTLGTAHPDPTEFIRVEVLPFSDVVAMVLSGEIMDAMTVVALRPGVARPLTAWGEHRSRAIRALHSRISPKSEPG